MYVKKEISFLNNAAGSAAELRCAFDIAGRLGYLEEGIIDEEEVYCDEIIRMLVGLIKAKSKT